MGEESLIESRSQKETFQTKATIKGGVGTLVTSDGPYTKRCTNITEPLQGTHVYVWRMTEKISNGPMWCPVRLRSPFSTRNDV